MFEKYDEDYSIRSYLEIYRCLQILGVPSALEESWFEILNRVGWA